MNSPVKKILILTANPKNTEKLRLDEEVRQIQEGLKRAKSRDQFEVVSEWAVTTDALRRAMLDHNPQIVHFSGHGAGEQGLALEDDVGKVKLVDTEALADLFGLFSDVECVLLNACYSEVQARAIAEHIGFVIGMSHAVGDKAARKFSVGFYDGLGAGRDIEFSYKLGCNAIRMEGIPEHLTPVITTPAGTSQAVAKSALSSEPTTEASQPVVEQAAKTVGSAPGPIKVFFSYSHKDEDLRDELAIHLTMLKRQGVIKAWHDREISAGTEWAGAIDDKLNSARIILLLISANFLASDYCYDIEMGRAMERHEAGEARVIPIILKPVDWSGAAFGKLQAVPKNAKPVTTWENQDEAFLNIAQAIRKAAQELAAAQFELTQPVPQPVGPTRELKLDSSETQSTSIADSTTVQAVVPLEPAIELDARLGQVPIDSPFYIERPPIEADCYRAVANPGALILIKAPRQMGKTSLMSRVLHHGKSEHGYRSVLLLFQEADDEAFTDLETFLQWFCSSVTYELNLEDKVADYWKGVLGNKQKCTNYFQRYLLTQIDSPMVLGLDEVDLLFEHFAIAEGFFSLLRAWHERAKNEPIWQKLRLVIDHSQEVYISLNVNQSPFNVGETFRLPEFNRSQVEDLVRRHGLNWSAAEIDQLMGMVDGHPYLLRNALYQIASGRLTLERFLQLAPTEQGPYGNHLLHHLSNINNDPKLRSALKRLVTSDRSIELESSLQFKLCSMGIAQLQGNSVEPLCNLYRIYFRDRLRDSE